MALQAFRHRQLTDAFYERLRFSEPLAEVELPLWHNVRATSLPGFVRQSNLHTSSTTAFGTGIRASKIEDQEVLLEGIYHTVSS